MSGGSHGYIQQKDAEDILENITLMSEIEYVADTLEEEYGELGQAACEATRKTAERAHAIYETIRGLQKELDDMMRPLKRVWRQVDYKGSGDVGKEHVEEALREYNRKHVPTEDAPVCDNPSGMYCPACRNTGLSHCSDPTHCGQMRAMKPKEPQQEPTLVEEEIGTVVDPGNGVRPYIEWATEDGLWGLAHDTKLYKKSTVE